MRKSSAFRSAAPIVAAALMIGCSRSESKSPGVAKNRDAAAGSREVVSLKGCVEAAPGAKSFVLRHVQLEPRAAQSSGATGAPGSSITEGSWVRLRMSESDQLRSQLGQIVTVSGTITDDGRNTLGTGGAAVAPDEPEARTDASRAATSEHHAKKQAQEAGPIALDSQSNGNVPEIAVERVAGTGEKCRVDLRPEKR